MDQFNTFIANVSQVRKPFVLLSKLHVCEVFKISAAIFSQQLQERALAITCVSQNTSDWW